MPDAIPVEETGEYRQRVRSLERQQDTFASQITSLGQRMDSQNQALSQKVDERVNAIGTKLDEKFNSISASQKPQWNVVVGACSLVFLVLSGLIGLITVPILAILVDLKTADKEIRTEFGDAMNRGRDSRTLEIRDLKMALMTDIRDMREDIVPRKEHQQYQALQNAQIEDLGRRVSEVRGDVKDIFSAKDIIAKLIKDVSDLQQRDRDRASWVPSTERRPQ